MIHTLLIGLSLVIPVQHPPEHAQLHEQFYRQWMVPPSRISSCCNKQDCAPAWSKWVSGQLYMRRSFEEKWTAIPQALLEANQDDPRESPDGQSHVCISAGGTPLCAVLGSGQ